MTDTDNEIDVEADDDTDQPPEGSLPLSTIIAKVEQSESVRTILEVEWEDGAWDVEYVDTENNSASVTVDPMTGELISDEA